jgi:signal transduction histidine kinase
LWKAYLGLGLLATGAYFFLPKGGVVQAIVFIGLGFVQLVAIGAGLLIGRPARPVFWYIVLTGQAVTVLGNVIWYVIPVASHTDPGFPSISDGLFLGSYAFSAAGLTVLIRTRAIGQGRSDFLDAAIITVGLAAISWAYIIFPNIEATGLDQFARVVSIAYPAADIILLGLAIRLGVSAGAGTPAHWFVILWIGSQLAGDSSFAVSLLDNHFAYGGVNFAGWLLELVFIGSAALHPSMARLASPTTAAPPAAFRSRLVLLCGASLIPLGLIYTDLLQGRPDETPVLVGFTAALFVLVTFRMAGLMGSIAGQRAALQREVAVREGAEARLRAQTADLARSNGELEQFAYVASHDLQEPLRMVGSYVGLLKRRYQGKLDTDADEFIEYAVDGVTRMQGLINDLLAYSRTGREARPTALHDAGSALDKALANLQASIQSSGATVSHGPLPSVAVSPLQLTQLFQNLVGNAIKFCRHGTPEVRVGAELNGGEWQFFVRDNGIGIEPQYRERIFQIFQRLHKRGEFPGTGIGLAICKKIVEGAGGRIWVESEPGTGSTFYFTFPHERVERLAA